ncbi:hypothetical protein HFO81_00935 [Rhizobium leguminosarum]|uniref:hypothetical protein n=1 Tax=Rhizobium leguminosarum TaxID=384 RepID=UPI001C98BB0B|nr:hypothetical protein [Rhizobium leguminosarum]MBY5504101.1 hypothetical protein [Rhizobium leguminosarum]
MRRGPRIGIPVSGRTAPTEPKEAGHPYKTDARLREDLCFREFENCNLIHDNIDVIRRTFFKERHGKQGRTNLRFVKTFIAKHNRAVASPIESADGVDLDFCVNFTRYCFPYKTRSQLVRFLWRLLKAIGVPSDIIPPNPYPDPPPKTREELDELTARRAVNLAKKDALVIKERFKTAEDLRSSGSDPRRVGGGKMGSWKELANRLWLCRHVLGLRVEKEEQLIKSGHRGIIRSMERFVGAVTIDGTEGARQEKGLHAHMRYYHPSLGDLVPFLVLLMARSMVNLQSVADLQVTEKWWTPYTYSLAEPAPGKEWVNIVFPKLRGAKGVQGVPNTPKKITLPSMKTPWSHPYQILVFVKELTAPLRQEVKRRIAELSANYARTRNEEEEFDRLRFIKNDMFLWRGEQGITSLRLATRESRGGTLSAITESLKRYGINGGVRQIRNVGLQFGFRASGYSLLILHLLARHSDTSTAARYARRQEFFKKSQALFVEVFDKSVALVRASKYSLANLTAELRESGLTDWQIRNVLDPENRSRYGNRCGDPSNPPEGFKDSTPPGQACRKQDCIDGCPLARFLPDALPFLIGQLASIEEQLAATGIAKEFQNSLSLRHQNINRIIAKYPAAAVEREKRRRQEKIVCE